MAKKLLLAIASCCLLLAPSMAGFAQQADNSPGNAAPPLKIGAGDLIEVTMFENPDLSGRYRVDQNGDVTVTLVGHVHVAGLTADEAAAALEKRYVEDQILLPAGAHATVLIAEYATQGINVSGEVKAPGVYPALGVRKLHDLIVAAGGVSQTASSQVVITRKDDPRTSHHGRLQPRGPQTGHSRHPDLSRRFDSGSAGGHCLYPGQRTAHAENSCWMAANS